MRKTLSYFNFCEARRLFGNIRIVFHHMKAQNLNFFSYIYTLYYQVIISFTLHLNLLGFLIFGIKFHFTEFLEQLGGRFPMLNVMEISDGCHAKCDRCYTNICKERTLQVDAHITPPYARPRSRDSFASRNEPQQEWLFIIDDYI